MDSNIQNLESPCIETPRKQLELPTVQIRFLLLFSRQGKLRLQKWYVTLTEKEKRKITRELMHIILTRSPKTSSFVDWKDLKLVYKSYVAEYYAFC
ncbi:unnamed protein product [Ranitomeya imitator]|uniref:AP complex mu/sigma subunit domain-containing protein n=1 Tax=Ranitomeya imitator TaxID=111125 RepID=A0ABN9M4P0_9NEOB|nr:unnamed protein product [Ranitomeya imitator]